MSATTHPTKPLDARELASRWQAMCTDPKFDDVIGKVELDEWGDVLMNPPAGVPHGRTATRIVVVLEKFLGGSTMVEVGVITSMGVRVPDVVWCSDAWLDQHPEKTALTSAPEICVEILSPSNTRSELRRKARAYIEAGAIEAWIVSPADRTVEVHAAAGHTESTTFPLNLADLFRN
jgi:Uma2 family endonuclease